MHPNPLFRKTTMFSVCLQMVRTKPPPLTPIYQWLNHQSKLGKDLIPDVIWDWQDLKSYGINASRRGEKDWKEKGKRGVKAESLILAADGMTSAGGRGWLSLFGFKGRRKISPETQFRKSQILQNIFMIWNKKVLSGHESTQEQIISPLKSCRKLRSF